MKCIINIFKETWDKKKIKNNIIEAQRLFGHFQENFIINPGI